MSFDNILCSSKHKYYLIDFSITEPVNNINNKLYLEWKKTFSTFMEFSIQSKSLMIFQIYEKIYKNIPKNKNLLKGIKIMSS